MNIVMIGALNIAEKLRIGNAYGNTLRRNRMKYLLTVDVPDEMEEPIYASVVKIFNYDYPPKEVRCPIRLIPMPLKRRTEVVWYDDNGRELITHEYTEKDKMWNEIVDYLEGE